MTLFLRIWAIMVGLLGPPIALFTGGFSQVLFIFLVASFFLSWPIFIFIHISGGSVVNILYGLNKPTSKREQLQGDYQKAKSLMADDQFNSAHIVICAVLEKDPAYGDALFLKAQILQRMGRLDEARQVIQTLLRTCKEDRVNRRWAHSLLTDINEQADQLHQEQNRQTSS